MIDRFDGTQYSFLSNFHTAYVVWEGVKYPTSEHAYQAAKTLNLELRKNVFGDMNSSPAVAKRAGRRIELRPDWESVKIDVMREIVRIKFQTHTKLAEKLLATGDEELVEGNTWGDRFWGQVDGVGENWLGKILMEVRGELRNELQPTK